MKFEPGVVGDVVIRGRHVEHMRLPLEGVVRILSFRRRPAYCTYAAFRIAAAVLKGPIEIPRRECDRERIDSRGVPILPSALRGRYEC